MTGKKFTLEVQPRIPEKLKLLDELANNLLYSWDRQVRSLFYRLDRDLWERSSHNPKLFLHRIEQNKLETAARDPVFLQDYERVLSSYNSYMQLQDRSHCSIYLDCDKDLISYSCAEFGLHESFPIYSGGLGILAGDYCKGMSDLSMPFVGVGLLYRQGYFRQKIDADGHQIAENIPSNFNDLPISTAISNSGEEVHIMVETGNRHIEAKVWLATAGHIKLVLLDTDIPANSEKDRRITHQLYGGNATNRLLQEMMLGIGGVRAQRALGLTPTIWHCNEGHSAFQILERCREMVTDEGIDFQTALEAVAANTVFTTHTPVAAGHDVFETSLITQHFADFIEELGITTEEFLKLGRSPLREDGFNMTALALRGSRQHNGVSRIHSRMASEMERYVWPQIPVSENPIRYVTNAVHVPTFLANEWANLFDNQFGGGWRRELCNRPFWDFIDNIPEYSYWSHLQNLKSNMLEGIVKLVTIQHRRNGNSESQIRRLIKYLKPQTTDVLTIGFARRFATYKRAALIFSDEERLAKLLGDPDRPVIFLFAGKAHPEDKPGQELIKQIYTMSRKPAFEGKVILVENYDIAVGRKLVSGVDVWLNNPEYPLEASGTSGQKAGINGVINLSVLDGWWAEGFNGENGWGITPHGANYTPEFRNHEEANELMDMLEQEVVPLYYTRNGRGFSSGWIRKSKASMKSILPKYNTQRMVMDYVRDFYSPAVKQGIRLSRDNYSGARELALWKQKVRESWSRVSISRINNAPEKVSNNDPILIEVAIDLNDLSPQDIRVECLFGTNGREEEFNCRDSQFLEYQQTLEDGRTLFALTYKPSRCGLQTYMLRCYPCHSLLTHQFETGRMLWVK
ncbi:MAG: alpha-glucan family phosphorylase [Pseudohongiellaceae bacterium]